MKKYSDKRAKIAKRYTIILREINEEREPLCESCGKPQYEHSHIIPKSRSAELIADKENIIRQCRDCHINWETGYIWLMDNGDKVMAWLKQKNPEYYMVKAYQMKDNAEGISGLPGWAVRILKEL